MLQSGYATNFSQQSFVRLSNKPKNQPTKPNTTMITLDTTNAIYNKYNALAAAGADAVTERNLHQLMMFALDSDYVDFDGSDIVLAKGGVVSRIDIENICGAEDLGSHFAIVLAASVVFVNKRTGDVRVFLAE